MLQILLEGLGNKSGSPDGNNWDPASDLVLSSASGPLSPKQGGIRNLAFPI